MPRRIFPYHPERAPSSFTYIASGFSSHVYHYDGPNGPQAVKISKRALTPRSAHRAVEIMAGEYYLVKRYLGQSVLDTTYSVASHLEDETKRVVVAVQPFIEGSPLPDALDSVNTDQLCDLYEAALDQYERHGTIPDVACIERGLFDPLKSPNIRVMEEDGRPVLIDPNLGRIQRSALLGPLWNLWISEGVKRALIDMESASHSIGGTDTEEPETVLKSS